MYLQLVLAGLVLRARVEKVDGENLNGVLSAAVLICFRCDIPGPGGDDGGGGMQSFAVVCLR